MGLGLSGQSTQHEPWCLHGFCESAGSGCSSPQAVTLLAQLPAARLALLQSECCKGWVRRAASVKLLLGESWPFRTGTPDRRIL